MLVTINTTSIIVWHERTIVVEFKPFIPSTHFESRSDRLARKIANGDRCRPYVPLSTTTTNRNHFLADGILRARISVTFQQRALFSSRHTVRAYARGIYVFGSSIYGPRTARIDHGRTNRVRVRTETDGTDGYPTATPRFPARQRIAVKGGGVAGSCRDIGRRNRTGTTWVVRHDRGTLLRRSYLNRYDFPRWRDSRFSGHKRDKRSTPTFCT